MLCMKIQYEQGCVQRQWAPGHRNVKDPWFLVTKTERDTKRVVSFQNYSLLSLYGHLQPIGDYGTKLDASCLCIHFLFLLFLVTLQIFVVAVVLLLFLVMLHLLWYIFLPGITLSIVVVLLS